MNNTGVNFKPSICFDDIKKDEDLIFFVLLLFLGNFHIHKKKRWTPNPVLRIIYKS